MGSFGYGSTTLIDSAEADFDDIVSYTAISANKELHAKWF
jgi:hypothetical protein